MIANRKDSSVSLYEQVGGEAAIGALVDSFYHRMLANPEVNEWFRGIDQNLGLNRKLWRLAHELAAAKNVN